MTKNQWSAQERWPPAPATAQAEQTPKLCTRVSNMYEEVEGVSRNYLYLDLIFQIKT